MVRYTTAPSQAEVRRYPKKRLPNLLRIRAVLSNLPMERYHALSDSTMDTLLESLEVLLDDVGDSNYEVEYHVRCGGHGSTFDILNGWLQSGVLTLRLGENGTYVINKQPPNKQIWLSSPFRYVIGIPHRLQNSQ